MSFPPTVLRGQGRFLSVTLEGAFPLFSVTCLGNGLAWCVTLRRALLAGALLQPSTMASDCGAKVRSVLVARRSQRHIGPRASARAGVSAPPNQDRIFRCQTAATPVERERTELTPGFRPERSRQRATVGSFKIGQPH